MAKVLFQHYFKSIDSVSFFIKVAQTSVLSKKLCRIQLEKKINDTQKEKPAQLQTALNCIDLKSNLNTNHSAQQPVWGFHLLSSLQILTNGSL